MKMHAVYCRTGRTGDEPKAVFRYHEDAIDYAQRESQRIEFEDAGYSIEPADVWIADPEAVASV